MMNRSITREELHEVFSYHFWRQRIPLTEQLETPGRNFSNEWQSAYLPENMEGLSFLDVGSNDGMFSYLAEQKGAKSVHATDIYRGDTQSNMTHGWSPIGIEMAKKLLQSQINIHSHGIYDLNKIPGQFDFVFCSNVLAWLRDPLLAMEELSAKASSTLFLREDISPEISAIPQLQLVRDFNSERQTCFYNPNRAWFQKVLNGLGFTSIEFKLIDEKKIAFEKYQLFPSYKIPAHIDVYESPISRKVIRKTTESIFQRSCYAFEGFRFFSDFGWVDERSLQQGKGNPVDPPLWKRELKKLLGKHNDWPQINYAIIARR